MMFSMQRVIQQCSSSSALRAAALSASRRSLTTTTRTMAIRSGLIPSMPRTSLFSTSTRQAELVELIEREYQEEIENEALKMPEEVATLKSTLESQGGWTIVDGDAMTRMHKTVGSLKLQVSFHCQDTLEVDDEEMLDDENVEPSPPIRFTVTATKAGQTMVFTCMSENATVVIQSVALSKESVDHLQIQGLHVSEYQGPEFTELAEDLQEKFHAFLGEECGLGEEVAAFIAMYADYKEQTQYVDFLKKTKALLS
jgi:complement component 1 Q subcomponent-binding protein, mitochondrial